MGLDEIKAVGRLKEQLAKETSEFTDKAHSWNAATVEKLLVEFTDYMEKNGFTVTGSGTTREAVHGAARIRLNAPTDTKNLGGITLKISGPDQKAPHDIHVVNKSHKRVAPSPASASETEKLQRQLGEMERANRDFAKSKAAFNLRPAGWPIALTRHETFPEALDEYFK